MKIMMLLLASACSMQAMDIADVIAKSKLPRLFKEKCIAHGMYEEGQFGKLPHTRPLGEMYFYLEHSAEDKNTMYACRNDNQEKLTIYRLPLDGMSCLGANNRLIDEDRIVYRLDNGLVRVLAVNRKREDQITQIIPLYDLEFHRDKDYYEVPVNGCLSTLYPQHMCGGQKCEKVHYEEFITTCDGEYCVVDKHGEMHLWDTNDIEAVDRAFDDICNRYENEPKAWQRIVAGLEKALEDGDKFKPTKKDRRRILRLYASLPSEAKKAVRSSTTMWKCVKKKVKKTK